MIRALALIVALVMMAPPAPAQTLRAPDEFTLERLSDDRAYVEYWNADPPNSGYAPPELVVGELVVQIQVVIGAGGGPETLIVTPPEGWIAIPPTIDVVDGDIGRVDLIRGEWTGS